jgi:phage-related protein
LFEVEFYVDDRGVSDLEEYLHNLDKKSKTSKHSRINYLKIREYLKILEIKGTKAGFPVTRPIEGYPGLWEIRPLKNRIFYFCFENNKIVLLHHFLKKSDKTPRKEIEVAVNRMNNHIRRKNS